MKALTYIVGFIVAGIVTACFIFGRSEHLDAGTGPDPSGAMTEVARSGHHPGLEDKARNDDSELIDDAPAKADNGAQGSDLNTRVSLFGESLGDPWQIYSNNIELAESGDADAQYEVSRVLFECKAVTSQELIDKHTADGLFKPAAASELQELLDWCRELNDNIGAGLMSQSLDWMNAAAEQGHVLARGRRITLAPFSYTASEARQAMTDVLRTGEPEMYWMMVSYFANYRDNDVVNYEAWMALTCRQIPACEIGEYRGPPALQPGEQKQVDETVAKIEAALVDGDLDDIAF